MNFIDLENTSSDSGKLFSTFNAPNGYELMELLGMGASGAVFRARQLNTGQLVALKILHRDKTLNKRQQQLKIERFEREVKLCAQLHHPHIVKILDKGRTDDNRLFAVFEFVPGVTLKDLLLRKGPLPAVIAGELMSQVLDALACAHEEGIVHRDLKPSNIMVSSTVIREHAMVLDFGISTFLPEARLADHQSLTLTRETLGTPSYSAPEQLRGEPPTPMSDLYAWGLVFIECLTGRPVMEGATLAEIFHKQLSPNDVPLPAAIIDHPLSGVLRRVLHKNQNERTCRADSLCSDLQKINLTTIVGELHKTGGPDSAHIPNHIDATCNTSSWPSPECERRQITVLCCSLGLAAIDKTDPELEPFEALQRDLLSLCSDIAMRYGGYRAGALGDRLMICFGYPLVRDNDARRAARAALEIAGQMRRRNAILKSRQGIRLELRIGMHSGMVMTRPDSPPAGFTPNIALRLESLARPGTILVSAATRQLLERYIDFKPMKSYPIGGNSQPIETFLLTRERQTEAFSFLLAGNARSPLTGRNKILSKLWKIRQNNTANKQGESILIIGEAGIGKSRLVYEMQRQLIDRGFMSRVCRCLPEYRNNALYPILEMLKVHLGLQETSLPEEVAKRLQTALQNCDCGIDQAIPILCSWLSLPFPEEIAPIRHSPERQKDILFKVLEQLILDMGDKEPFLLIFEDLHWADTTSLELIERITAAASGTAIFTILTARPQFSASRQAEKHQVLNLSRLAARDVETMIQKIANNKPLSPSALNLIAERTDGIPLFIEEFTRMLLDMNYLVEQNGIYVLDQRFDSTAVPITLHDLLEERLAKLGPAKETAQIASVIGRDFDYSLLIGVSLRDEAFVQADLEQIAAAGLIYKQRHVQGESYIFRHALIRDAAYNSMLRGSKEQAHGRVADILEHDFPQHLKTNPAVVARHFAEAGIFAKAVDYGTRAAKISLERSLNDETIAHADKVFPWIKHIEAEKQAEAELNINSIKTLAMMGKYGWAAPQVIASATKSRELLDDMEQTEHLAPTIWSLATYHHVAGNRSDVRRLTDELSAIAEQSGDIGLKVAAATFLGLRYQTDGKYTLARQTLEQAIKLYDPLLHKDHRLLFGLDTRIWAAGTLAIVYWFVGYEAVAIECGENAISWARELNHIPSLGMALLYRSLGHFHTGDKEAVANIIDELLSISKKFGLPAFEGYATVLHCWTTGEAELATNILKSLQQLGCKLALSLYGSMLADIHAQNGDFDAAIKEIDHCLARCSEIDEHLHEPVIHKRRADYLLKKYPHGNDEIANSLRQSAQCAQAQGMLRIEAEAISELSLVFGTDTLYRKRLAEIINLRPEIKSSISPC